MATVLQKYFEDGWLKFGNDQISAQGRFDAGNRFYADFYKAGIVDLRIPDLSKPRVDGGNAKSEHDFVLDAKTRFNKAFMSLNPEQSYILWQIVCLDKPIKLKRTDEYRHGIEVLKEKICESLDALYVHYWGKLQTVYHHRIEAFIDDKCKKDFEVWKKNLR